MALSVGASSQGVTGYGTTLSSAAVTTAGSGSTFAVFVMSGTGNTAPTSVTDNKGNTYTQQLSATYTASYPAKGAWLYTCENGAGGSGHTATATFTAINTALIFPVEILGGATFDVGSPTGGAGTGVTSTTQTTPSITTTAADVVLSFGFSGDYTLQASITDSYSNLLQTYLTGNTTGVAGAVGALVQSGAGTTSDTFTFATGIAGGAIIAAWKPSGGGGGGGGGGTTDISVGSSSRMALVTRHLFGARR